MLIVTETTIVNRAVLETGFLPKRFLGRVLLVPRRAGLGLSLRMILEIQPLRYMATLLPFVIGPLMFRDLALPVMQAPALMLVLVAVVELRVLRLSKAARARLMPPAEAARRSDMLTFRARACLRLIAAHHAMDEGQLHLVVEQSELARVAPLTLVSVQTDRPEPHLLALDTRDRAVLAEGLFDAAFGERDLLQANHHEGTYLRDILQEARAVSAHTRLAALLHSREGAR